MSKQESGKRTSRRAPPRLAHAREPVARLPRTRRGHWFEMRGGVKAQAGRAGLPRTGLFAKACSCQAVATTRRTWRARPRSPLEERSPRRSANARGGSRSVCVRRESYAWYCGRLRQGIGSHLVPARDLYASEHLNLGRVQR